MTSYTETKIIALTSQSASQFFNGSYLSDVAYNFGSIYNNSSDIIHKQIQLLNAQIPYSFYVINYTNNLLKTNISGSIVAYTIPTGNYNGNSLITAIKASLGNPASLAITLSSVNGRLTFTNTTSITIYNDFRYSIGGVLGFSDNTNYTGTTIIGDFPLNLLGIKTLQIRSSNLIMSNISSVQGGQTTLLSTIPVDCVPFGMLNYVDKGSHLMTIMNDSLDDICIDIIDGESSEYINFNNQDWCITLAIHLTRTLLPVVKSTFSSIIELPTFTNKEVEVEGTKVTPNPLLSENKDVQDLQLLTT